MRWREAEPPKRRPGKAPLWALLGRRIALCLAVVIALLAPACSSHGHRREAPPGPASSSSNSSDRHGESKSNTPTPFTADNLRGLQWVEVRLLESSTGAELSHARAVMNADTGDIVLRVTGPNGTVVGDAALVGGFFATRTTATARWVVGRLSSKTGAVAPLPPELISELARAERTDALPSVAVDVDSGLSVVVDTDTLAAAQAGTSGTGSASAGLVQGSRLRWSRWWRAGRLVAEEVAAWVAGDGATPVGVIETRAFAPINRGADVLGWAPAVGISDLAAAWKRLPADATSPAPRPSVARGGMRLGGWIVAAPPAGLVKTVPVSASAVQLPPTPPVSLPAIADFAVALSRAYMGSRGLLTVAVVAPAVLVLAQAINEAFNRAASALFALTIDVAVPPVITASIPAWKEKVQPRPIVISIPKGTEPPPDCRDPERREKFRQRSREQDHHIFPKRPPRGEGISDLLRLREQAATMLRRYFGEAWLDGPENLFPVFQQGNHHIRYHKWIYDRIIEADRLAGGDANEFLRRWNGVRKYIDEHPEILDHDYWCNRLPPPGRR